MENDSAVKNSGTGPDNPGDKNSSQKTFTQEELEKILGERLARERKKFEEREKELLAEANKLAEDKRLTEEERQQWKQRAEELEQKYLSAEELAAKTRKRAEQEFGQKLAKAEEEAKRYRSEYEKYRIRAEILRAAEKNKALDAQQVYDLLWHKARVEPVLDEDGKPTGEYRTMLTVQLDKEDGSTEEKDLVVEEAVKVFLEQPRNFNLVDGGSLKGGSGFRAGALRNLDAEKIAQLDVEEYARLRAEGKIK